MHGWSEVEHDLIYKPESGELSEDEHAILDELNGMVIAGEIALELLQRAVERRLGQNSVRFESHYDLAVFLNKWLRSMRPSSEPPMGMQVPSVPLTAAQTQYLQNMGLPVPASGNAPRDGCS